MHCCDKIMPQMDCCNGPHHPHQIPGYMGEVKGYKFSHSKTFGHATHDLMTRNRRIGAHIGARKFCLTDPCWTHQKELRARLHMVQGEIDPNPCKNTNWNLSNQFCIKKPLAGVCPPVLYKNNQHGYLSRISVYQSPDMQISACKAKNVYPCKERAPNCRPFYKEYEDITDYDIFQEWPCECRHLRLPNLKYKEENCWDKEYYLPIEVESCYEAHGYTKPKPNCQCLPLDAKKRDKDITFYRHEPDPKSFGFPYFMDPTNPHRFFVSGYTGHVPTNRFRISDSYVPSTRKALNRFTLNYLTPHFLEKCPVYIDPKQYCCDVDHFNCYCDKRKTYDGHIDEVEARCRLRDQFNPKDCQPVDMSNEPLPICVENKNCPGC